MNNQIINNNIQLNQLINNRPRKRRNDNVPEESDNSSDNENLNNNIRKSQTNPNNNFLIKISVYDNFPDIKQYITNLHYYSFSLAWEESIDRKPYIFYYIQFTRSTRISFKKIKNETIINKFINNKELIELKRSKRIIYEDGIKKKKGRFSIKEVLSMNTEQQMNLPINYYNMIIKINNGLIDPINLNDINKQIHVYYIYGKSGSGKTDWVLSCLKRNNILKCDMISYINKFWVGVTNKCYVCLYDNFNDSNLPMEEFINFIDNKQHYLNIKGGYMKNIYKYIFITSIIHPYELYLDDINEENNIRDRFLSRLIIWEIDHLKNSNYIPKIE